MYLLLIRVKSSYDSLCSLTSSSIYKNYSLNIYYQECLYMSELTKEEFIQTLKYKSEPELGIIINNLRHEN